MEITQIHSFIILTITLVVICKVLDTIYSTYNKNNNIETFDFVGGHPWYRDDYSIVLHRDTINRHERWNTYHRRKWLHINNYIYPPREYAHWRYGYCM